jgi:uncharacterized membrane protein YjgN (DUF898 family)
MLDDSAATPVAPAAAVAEPRVLAIRFTGSGSEYFRIWAVNLLLILVTLGLYLPFAKARRIRYFYANTLVDGQALSFHGDPWKMFRGFLLMVVLMALYGGLEQVSRLASVAALIALVLLWPPLWRAGMRFRLSNTGWRGLRFGFSGDVAGAYRVFLPVSVPLVLVALMPEDAGLALRGLAGIAGLALNLMIPWTLGLAKRYQHNNYLYAGQRSSTWLEPSNVYGLSFRAGALGSIAIILAGILAAILVPSLGAAGSWLPIAGAGLVYLLAYVWVSSAFTAGLQNMVWSRTRSESIGFRSELDTWALARLSLKNWLLMIITLGLYRPFAVVALAGLRLQAISLDVTGDIDTWAGTHAGHADATGDIAGDFFGIDMGL